MARLTPVQFQKATRAKYGLIPRPPKSEVPSITRREYGYVLDRWARFDPFRSWRDAQTIAGHQLPKPPNVWRQVPMWEPSIHWGPWQLLEEIRKRYPLDNSHPQPPQPQPQNPPFSLAMGQCWFVIAEDYWEAVSGPNYFGRAFVADDAYAQPSREEVAVLRQRGIRTAGWGDSRPSGGTSPQKIIDFCNEIKCDTPIFQGELLVEADAAMKMIDNLGGRGYPMVGNLSQMQTDAGIWKRLTDRMNLGVILWINECYKNCGQGGPDWKNQIVCGNLDATYKDSDCPGMDMETFYANGWATAHRDSWYTAQWTADLYARAR